MVETTGLTPQNLRVLELMRGRASALNLGGKRNEGDVYQETSQTPTAYVEALGRRGRHHVRNHLRRLNRSGTRRTVMTSGSYQVVSVTSTFTRGRSLTPWRTRGARERPASIAIGRTSFTASVCSFPEGAKLRVVDCIDCHDRPAHIYGDHSWSLDEALESRAAPHELPHAKRALDR